MALLFSFSPARAQPASATAVFAGGCFWCIESDFQDRDGVLDAVSGFTGGTLKNPTYSGNHAGHYEAVKITYDPRVISYQALLEAYWRSIDPFDAAGQFCDKGPSYRAAIFAIDAQQKQLAQASKERVIARFPQQAVVTEILDATEFWPVEEYHQDYYLKNPVRYKYYRWSCGRDQRLRDIWGDQAS
ncbi:MAG: peptide-methionine (S)-S-oxide reductase MsrA [Gammaproteobacteria bacterium]|nr:peptide-methionine (S)-S-oxide reductase MsrA [Gammaproteobacteria bacterium]